MNKYATAIKQGTATTEAILRRFTESASHPAYQAMLEVGRAQKIIFVARYLRLRELQEGLNMVGSSNGANSVIFYGEGGDIATNRREELEMSVLCLRILQAALVYINTLMLQDVLADPRWAELLEPADLRGLTPAVLAACPALRRGTAGRGQASAAGRRRGYCAAGRTGVVHDRVVVRC
ncbi:MAG TPA: Tn3 family transposase [Nonomuraea sp.]|nr:Tn3 family transposase [Nonomuraea sp.]